MLDADIRRKECEFQSQMGARMISSMGIYMNLNRFQAIVAKEQVWRIRTPGKRGRQINDSTRLKHMNEISVKTVEEEIQVSIDAVDFVFKKIKAST